MGDTSYGDEPFDGYTNACIALIAVEHIPDLGKPFGVIGGGIHLPLRERSTLQGEEES